MSFSKYPAYKDSGVDWQGVVPEHWDIRRLKFIASINDEVLPENADPDYEFQYVDIGSVDASEGVVRRETQVFGTAPSRARRIVRTGDTIVSTVRTYLRAIAPITKADDRSIVSTGFAVIRPRRVSGEFLSYVLREASFVETVVARSVGVSYPAINASEIGDVFCPFPTYNEQVQIAHFLDYQTAKIDALIEEQQRLIELLKEKRQAVISHAVTKGLDPNAPMKDSAVVWLGEVPAHWNITPLKHLITLNPVKSAFTGDHSQLCSFIPMEKLKTGHIVLDEERVVADVFDGYTYFENGDVLQAKVTPCFENKNIAIAEQLINGVGFGSTEINACRPNENVSSQFLYYRLQEDTYMSVCTASMTGAGGLKRVPTDTIEEFRIALPDICEQLQIVLYLDEAVKQLDDLTAHASNGIDLLYERRSALISAAVTGKIDVRDWQPRSSPITTRHENAMEVA